MDLQQARSNMIEQQVRPWDVLDQRVLAVLSDIPRETFLDPAYAGVAYSDFALPIGHGQNMLKPTIDGRLLQSLLLEVTDTVLEIGTGSGYLTSCLAKLTAHCDSIEIIPELHNSAAARLKESGVSNVTLKQQDAAQEWDARDAYQAIAFSGAVPAIPDFYKQKLAVGGRLFAVVGDIGQPTMDAQLMTRISEVEWLTESLFETRIDPLVNFELEKPSFTF